MIIRLFRKWILSSIGRKFEKKIYPNLSVMGWDVLSVPVTTVAFESTFSIGGRVITKYRNCIHHENIQRLITIRN